MGLFDFISGSKPKQTNVVHFGKQKQILPPKHFGYHSFQWGMQQATALVEIISSIPQSPITGHPSLVQRIIKDPWPANWHFTALYGGVHLAYAHLIMHIPQNLLKEVLEGIHDGVDGLKNNSGPVKEEYRNAMKQLILDHYKAIINDYHNLEKYADEVQQGVINFKGRETYQLFDRYVCPAYSLNEDQTEEFSPMEKMMIQPIIDGQPAEWMVILRDELQIYFIGDS